MPVEYLDATARLVLALVLWVLIGLGRQVRGSPAGVRTFGPVSIGACLDSLVGLFSGITSGGAPGDQGRIAAQVVTGVGFLGGGMLIHTGASVHGLTTAAGIWVAGAVGLAAGEGLYYLAIAATLLVLVVLRVLRWVERRFHLGPHQAQDELSRQVGQPPPGRPLYTYERSLVHQTHKVEQQVRGVKDAVDVSFEPNSLCTRLRHQVISLAVVTPSTKWSIRSITMCGYFVANV